MSWFVSISLVSSNPDQVVPLFQDSWTRIRTPLPLLQLLPLVRTTSPRSTSTPSIALKTSVVPPPFVSGNWNPNEPHCCVRLLTFVNAYELLSLSIASRMFVFVGGLPRLDCQPVVALVGVASVAFRPPVSRKTVCVFVTVRVVVSVFVRPRVRPKTP